MRNSRRRRPLAYALGAIAIAAGLSFAAVEPAHAAMNDRDVHADAFVYNKYGYPAVQDRVFLAPQAYGGPIYLPVPPRTVYVPKPAYNTVYPAPVYVPQTRVYYAPRAGYYYVP